ncbi:MAG: hypothetical protein C0625_02475 [Arcobacter sp.]|nr:MAG: hypothetical protein C0625_02475 [Arcobacter sp.]
MLKILAISFMIFSFSFSNETMSDEKLMEPSMCEKVYNNCVDECDAKNSDNISECYLKCEVTADKCLQAEEEKETQEK